MLNALASRAFNAQGNTYQAHGDSWAMKMSCLGWGSSRLAGSAGLCTIVPIQGGMEASREPRTAQTPDWTIQERVRPAGHAASAWSLAQKVGPTLHNMLDKTSKSRKEQGRRAVCRSLQGKGRVSWFDGGGSRTTEVGLHRMLSTTSVPAECPPVATGQSPEDPLSLALSRSCLAGGSGGRPWSLRGQESTSSSP